MPYKTITTMRNNKFYFAICLLGASLLGCQKENTPLPGNSSVAFRPTMLTFQVGDRSYELSGVGDSNADQGQSCQSSLGESYNSSASLEADWTRYAVAGKFLTITRQQEGASPALRLTLVGTIDLDAMTLPATVTNAHFLLADPAGSLVSPGDNPAASSSQRQYDGLGEAVTLTITSKTGNMIRGTFSGIVSTPDGAKVQLQEGHFQANIIRH